jgi:hypothetical protein
MLTFDEARELIEKFVQEERHSVPVMIDEESTEEHDFGWLFYVNSREFLETRDIQYCLIGAGPIFVERETGRTIHTGSVLSTETLIEAYRATGDPHARREVALLVSVAPDQRVDVQSLALARRRLGASPLRDAMKWAERIVGGEVERLDFSEFEDLDRARDVFEGIGVRLEQPWSLTTES